MAELGLMGVNVPAALGGAEAGAVSYALAMREISRGCAATAVTMAVTNMVSEVITGFGTEAQRETYVPRLVGGEYVAGSFALSEPGAGSDPGAMRTTAVRRGDRWVINGDKQWITSGDRAGVFVVWARTGGPGTAGLSAFLVEGTTPGLKVGKREDKMGIRASSTVPLVFEDCVVPASALLGVEGGGFKIAMMALDGGQGGHRRAGPRHRRRCARRRAAVREATASSSARRSGSSRRSSGCWPTATRSSTRRAGW